MFRPSGPDHVLAKTAKIRGKPHRKWMWNKDPPSWWQRLHRWRPPPPSSPCCGSPGDKDCIDDDLLPPARSVDGHTPTPLIALIIMLVPWRNSSLEFILVSGSRWEILTPSLAFLLCGLKKTPVWIISKCSNKSISILPSCFSMIYNWYIYIYILCMSMMIYMILKNKRVIQNNYFKAAALEMISKFLLAKKSWK